jgi:hypothetical protein
MSDTQAVELLQLLDLYCDLPDSDPDTLDLTVRMVAGDLIGSLPVGMIPELKHLD